MIYVSPLPDELNISYFGRLIEINGLPTEDLKALKLLKEMVPLDPLIGHRVPFRLQVSAFSANMSVPQFVQHHTLYPYRRAISSHFCDWDDPRRTSASDDFKYRPKPLLGVTRALRDEAYFCLDCVSKESKDGMSYWHRTHQLHGIFICPTHGRPLQLMGSHDAFRIAPSKCVPMAHNIDEKWALQIHSNPFVREFTKLSIKFIALEKSIHLKSIWALLAHRATEAGLSVEAAPDKRLISDLIVECYPQQWLTVLFPQIALKRQGEFFAPIDRVLSVKSLASRIPAYLLVLCALFRTADDAFHALLSLPEY